MPQTTRGIFPGKAVPAPEKTVSLFEPHSTIICKGNPAEDAQLPTSLDHHLRVFQHPPRLLTEARGFHTTTNERYAITRRVTQVVLPKPGAKSATRMAHE
jgi:IS5 family transposase